MHISDGVLSPPIIAITSVTGLALAGFALRGVRPEVIPKISLMSAVFFVGSSVHLPVGAASVHLMLCGFIGLALGRHAPISVLIALLLQLFLLHFGGLTSLGANLLTNSFPGMLLGISLRNRIARSAINGANTFLYGFACGSLAVIGSVAILAVILIQSNMRFGMGPFSTVALISVVYLPLALIEGLVTGFAVQFIAKLRPNFFVEISLSCGLTKESEAEQNYEIRNYTIQRQ